MSDSLALQGVGAQDAARRGWIHSPGFDLSFFILSPLAGFALAILGVQYSLALPAVLIGASYMIGVPHYLASFAFFLGDENRAHARRFWPLFYVGPLLICIGVVALYTMQAAHVVFAALFVWNVYHVATQSSGILSLYRRLSGGGCARTPSRRIEPSCSRTRRWRSGSSIDFPRCGIRWLAFTRASRTCCAQGFLIGSARIRRCVRMGDRASGLSFVCSLRSVAW
jgi:hypothetical protein